MPDTEFPGPMPDRRAGQDPQPPPSANRPVASRKFDRVDAAIWRKEFDDGKSSFSVTFSRRFPDERGEWHTRYTMGDRDLPHLKLAVDWAMKQLLMMDE